MTRDRVERRLAAIVAADVAGYSRLMGLDEVDTVRTLREHRVVTDALVAKHGGRLVKTTGDGVLLEFPSVVDAVECAVAVQAVMAQRNEGVPVDRRMLFRIGINLGDILIEGDDILGDGVNIAARLEGIAEPGGICISYSAYDQVRNKILVGFADLGEQQLKNIERPVRAYAVKSDSQPGTLPPSQPATAKPLPLPDKPSIAVLPFQNMSGDPEQEYFADEMVEDIITGLSRNRGLFVIARNSTFTYKNKTVDIKRVGRDLGVLYVLEGSVRKSGEKLRITGQLIEAATGMHLWADKFDGSIADIFKLQDEITASVVGAVAPELERAEVARAKKKPTESLQAYDYYLRGVAKASTPSEDSYDEALSLYQKAIELDPEFALAYAAAAGLYGARRNMGVTKDFAREDAESQRLARRALALGQDNALVLARAGFSLAQLGRNPEAAADYLAQAIMLDPNLAAGWYWSGWTKVYLGDHDAAIEDFERSLRLSPLEPRIHIAKSGMAFAHFFQHRFDDAIAFAESTSYRGRSAAPQLRVAIASYALSGRQAEAEQLLAQATQMIPSFADYAREVISTIPYRRAQDVELLVTGLRRAGVAV